VIAAMCAASLLAGTFSAIPNSPGAGNVVYALVLRNVSQHDCFVSGIPGVTLLDRHGHRLPTHVRPAQPGALTAVRVDMPPGARARATARFSPDVPGPGEGTIGRCEPVAQTLRVAPGGGGALRAPIRPPTSVCEHGSMTWTVLTAMRG
jgi:hypothetical protein